MPSFMERITPKPLETLFRKVGAEATYRKLIRPYLAKTQTKLIMTGILAVDGGILGSGVYQSYLWKDIVNSLTMKELPAFTQNMEYFVCYAAFTAAACAMSSLLRQKFQFGWANYARTKASEVWLSGQNRAQLVTINASMDPAQRITSDIGVLTDQSTALSFRAISNVVTMGTFSAVLWGLSPPFFGAMVAFTAVGNGVLYYGGRKFKQIDDAHALAEGEYRKAVIGTQAHFQNIALWGGEEAVQKALKEKQKTLQEAELKRNKVYVRLSFISNL